MKYSRPDTTQREVARQDSTGGGCAYGAFNFYINTLEQWLHSNRKKVSSSKSTLTLITPHADEYNLQPTITLNNVPIPYTKTPTTLGVTYDKKINSPPT